MSFVEMAKGMELKCLQNRCQRSTTDTALDTVDTNIDTACLRIEMAADVAGSKPSGCLLYTSDAADERIGV